MVSKSTIIWTVAASIVVSGVFVVFFLPDTAQEPAPSPSSSAMKFPSADNRSSKVPAEQVVLAPEPKQDAKKGEIAAPVLENVFVAEASIQELARAADTAGGRSASFFGDTVGGDAATVLQKFRDFRDPSSFGTTIAGLQQLLDSGALASSSATGSAALGIGGLASLILGTPTEGGLGSVYKDFTPVIVSGLQTAQLQGKINESQLNELSFALEELLPKLLNSPR